MNRYKKWIILGLGVFLGLQTFSAQRSLLGSSGSQKVQLLELYTSESCSSCPPADQWFSDLQNKSDLWKHFVPVVFHVDYWNNLGWKDTLSSKPMTERQIEISHLWPTPRVYTPGVVVDGQEWQDWRESINHALPKPATNHEIHLYIFKEQDGSLTLKVEGQKSTAHYIVRMAQLGMGLSSNVTNGENSGRILKHNFSVLSWQSRPLDNKKPEESFKFAAPQQKISRLAIAAWIEETGNPTPLQAAGGYL